MSDQAVSLVPRRWKENKGLPVRITADPQKIGQLALGFFRKRGLYEACSDPDEGNESQVYGLYLQSTQGDQGLPDNDLSPMAISHGEETH